MTGKRTQNENTNAKKEDGFKKNLMDARDSSRGLNIFAPDFYELY